MIRLLEALGVWGLVAVNAFAPTVAGSNRTTSVSDGSDSAGVIVLTVLPESYAENAGIYPGDLIIQLNDHPIEDVQQFVELAESLADDRREVVIVSYDEKHRVRLWNGELGAYLGNYREPWGAPLVEAIRVFHQEGPAYAVGFFEKAIAAGQSFDSDSVLQPMYALALHDARKVDAAKAQLNDYAGRIPDGQGWVQIMGFFRAIRARADSLYLFAARGASDHPVSPELADLADRQAFVWQRFPEAIVSARRADIASLSATQRGLILDVQRFALDEMRLVPEAMAVVRIMRDHPGSAGRLGHAAYTAERNGKSELAADLARSMFDRQTAQYRSAWAAEAIRLSLQTGDFTAAMEVAKGAARVNRYWMVSRHIPPGFGGVDAEPVWLTLAEHVREQMENDVRLADAAIGILGLQPQPDLAELKALMARRQERVREDRLESTPEREARLAVEVAMLQGQFDRAAELLDGAGEVASPSLREAVRFLLRFGASLTEERAIWLRTMRAFPLPDGGWFLLTRDQRLGRSTADADTIREIPPPLAAWWIHDPDHAILVSSTGHTILATNQRSVLRLDEGTLQWQVLSSKPWWLDREWDLSFLEPVLDDLAAALVEDGRKDLVWPDQLRTGPERLTPFMLSDGTWLVFDHDQPRLLRPRELLTELTGRPVAIYGMQPAAADCERVYLFSSTGIFDWRPYNGEIALIELPGGASGPVMLDSNRSGVPVGAIRIAKLPSGGGDTFLLDLKSGRVVHEGLVNERLPETFWLQRSSEANRRLLKTALEQSGLGWPAEWATQLDDER